MKKQRQEIPHFHVDCLLTEADVRINLCVKYQTTPISSQFKSFRSDICSYGRISPASVCVQMFAHTVAAEHNSVQVKSFCHVCFCINGVSFHRVGGVFLTEATEPREASELSVSMKPRTVFISQTFPLLNQLRASQIGRALTGTLTPWFHSRRSPSEIISVENSLAHSGLHSSVSTQTKRC